MDSRTGWHFGVLGALEVVRDGQPIAIAAAKQRTALAALLLHAGHYVSPDQLVEWMWDENAPGNARGAVHTHIARLRRSLGDGSHLIQTRDQGYIIQVEPESLDVTRFFALLENAAEAARNGAADREAELLRRALALWRGPVLANVPSESLHRDRIPRLTEEHLRTLERWLDLSLRLGRHGEIVPDLAAATAAHPLRERLWARLMLALYRSGRPAEALEAYHAVAERLRDDLGIDPGDELRRLHRAILSGDPDLDLPSDDTDPAPSPPGGGSVRPGPATAPRSAAEVPHEKAAPARRTDWHPLNQLPPGVADFVGRAEAMAAGLSRLAVQDAAGLPIVALCGPPGVGKSALAVHLAHRLKDRFPDGRLYFRLDGASPCRPRDPAEVLAELLRMTGTSPAAIPDDLDRRSSAMRARLAGRRVLLLLDDVADIAQILPLLPGDTGCAVLITSRRQLLGLPGADVIPVGPFSEEESRELLGRLIGDARVARETAAADDIGAACGRLPLALRIAGARLAARPNWTLSRLAERLQDDSRRLDELTSGDLAVRPGLQLSYATLPETAQTAFRRAGLLAGADFAAWTVGALVGVPDGEPLVEHLLQANLLEAVGTDIAGEPRYRLHDLLAVYARELLAADDPARTRAAERRLLDALLAIADLCYRKLERQKALDDLRPEPYQVRRALPRSQADELSRAPLRWLLAERRQLVDAVERACGHGRHRAAAALMDRVSEYLDVYVGRAEMERVRILIRDAALAAGDERVAWRAELNRCAQKLARGLLTEAAAGLRRCVDAFDRLDLPYELAHSLGALAFCLTESGEPETALAPARRAVDAARASGDEHVLAATLRDLGAVLAHLDRYGEAAELLNRAVALARRLGRDVSTANILGRLASTALRHGDLPTARSAVDEATGLLGGDDPYGTAWLLYLDATITVAEGRPRDALSPATRARVRFTELGDRRGENLASIAEGEALIALGRTGEAAPLLETAAAALAALGMDAMAEHARQLMSLTAARN